VVTKRAASASIKAGSNHPPVVSKLRDGITVLTEDLDSQTIDGFVTSRIRTTATYPPVTMGGNDRAMTYTDEGWFSCQLQVTVRGQWSSPTSGRATSALKSLKLAEPDPALLRVPEGYRIVDDDYR
jgi:hypothetical protein